MYEDDIKKVDEWLECESDDMGNVIGYLFRASYVKKITNLDID